MDNISGSANWTVYDTPVKKKQEIVKEEPEKAPPAVLPIDDFRKFLKVCKMNYQVSPSKDLGDAIVLLEAAYKIL